MSFIDKILNRKSDVFSIVDLPQKTLYEVLDEYYDNNNLYNAQLASAYIDNRFVEAMKPIRTCVNRSIEFYSSKVAPSKTQINAKNEKVKEAIEQFLKWSNFETQKRLSIRNFSLHGNLFWKLISKPDKVYFEIIKAKYVNDFKTDNRGYITEIRIDIPIVDEEGKNLTHTEYWSKQDGYMAIWIHSMGENAKLDQLGDPKEIVFLYQLGIDFIPIVHMKFKDTGNLLGVGAVNHALIKIDEANREATRLSQMLFRHNKPYWAVTANASDKLGRPIPAPKINGSIESTEVEDSSIFYLPGESTLQSMIPNIDYEAALKILQSMEEELEKDLPELKYYSIKESELSAKALKMLLAGAIDRLEEARENLIAGLQRLNEMALTIGQFIGVFKGLGTYEAGSFEHELDLGDSFKQDKLEQATTLQMLTSATMPLELAMQVADFSEEEIKLASELKQKEQENALAQFTTSFNRI